MALPGKVVGRLVQTVRALDTETSEKLRGKAPSCLAHLRETGPTTLTELTKAFSTARSIVEKLEALGLVAVERSEVAVGSLSRAVQRDAA